MSILQPQWKTVKYSRNQIINAGKTIRKACSKEEEKLALEIIDNWRSAHAYPLQVIYMHLKNMTSSKESVIVAQRLKRLDSIVEKLKRERTMSLWSIQDLGGCRVIVPSVEDVYDYYNKYRNSRIRHRFVKEYNYIEEPKLSGYRSLHVVYEFHSDRKEDYNRNMLIEIQFRTHLQHLWATAVETMGLFKNEAIKAGEGDQDTKRFFALVSSLFALEEKMPLVPGTPSDRDAIIEEIKCLDKKHSFLDFLTSIRVMTKIEEKEKSKRNGYCVLSLDYDKKQLSIRRFNASQIDDANKYYIDLENQLGKNADTVLVRVSSFSVLKSAYPNYFSDISEFVDRVKKYC